MSPSREMDLEIWGMSKEMGRRMGEVLVEATERKGCWDQALTKAVAAQSGTLRVSGGGGFWAVRERASQSGLTRGVLAVGELRGGVTGALDDPP